MKRLALALLLVAETACGTVAQPHSHAAAASSSPSLPSLGAIGGPASMPRLDTPAPPPVDNQPGGSPLIDGVSPLVAGRGYAMIAWDSWIGKPVLFGGWSSKSVLSDTWTWDGQTWTDVSYSSSVASAERIGQPAPEPRVGGTLFYDQLSRSVILFGGWSRVTNRMLNDTWFWDGAWHQANRPTAPSPRSFAPAVFDPRMNKTVVFGGWTGDPNSAYNDTWTWDGSNWVELSVTNRPAGLFDAALGYRSSDQKLLLVGSPMDHLGTQPNQGWLFDGTVWTAVRNQGTAPNCHYEGGAGDAVHSTVVLFGNCNGTFVWDGSTWSQVASGPHDRGDEGGTASMTYAPGLGVITYGGHIVGTSDYWSDLWVWDGQQWTRKQ